MQVALQTAALGQARRGDPAPGLAHLGELEADPGPQHRVLQLRGRLVGHRSDELTVDPLGDPEPCDRPPLAAHRHVVLGRLGVPPVAEHPVAAVLGPVHDLDGRVLQRLAQHLLDRDAGIGVVQVVPDPGQGVVPPPVEASVDRLLEAAVRRRRDRDSSQRPEHGGDRGAAGAVPDGLPGRGDDDAEGDREERRDEQVGHRPAEDAVHGVEVVAHDREPCGDRDQADETCRHERQHDRMVRRGPEGERDERRQRDDRDHQPQELPPLGPPRSAEPDDKRHRGQDESERGEGSERRPHDPQRGFPRVGQSPRAADGGHGGVLERARPEEHSRVRERAGDDGQGCGQAPPWGQRRTGGSQVQDQGDQHEPRDEDATAEHRGQVRRRDAAGARDRAVPAVAVEQATERDAETQSEEQPAHGVGGSAQGDQRTGRRGRGDGDQVGDRPEGVQLRQIRAADVAHQAVEDDDREDAQQRHGSQTNGQRLTSA